MSMRDTISLAFAELQMISYHTSQSFGLFNITGVFSIDVIVDVYGRVVLVLIVLDRNWLEFGIIRRNGMNRRRIEDELKPIEGN